MTNKTNSNPLLKWGKRLILLLLGIALGVAVIVAGALLFLDDDDYRDLLIREADKYLDARLEINGQFSISLGKEISLTADEVLLRANDGSYTLSVNEFHLQQRPGSYLMTGTFWINSLVMSDAQLHVKQGDDREFDLAELTLPPVVIEEARFHNLHLFYQEKAPGKTHEIALLDLVIDDVNNTGPLGIQGDGLVNGQPLSIGGSLGSLADLIDGGQPYSARLDISSGTLECHVSGSIADPVKGKGLDLQVTLKDPELSRFLKLFDITAPAVGSLSAQAQVFGDYASPGLDHIDVHLQRGGAVDMKIDGKVDNLMTGAGLELRVAGHSSDPKVLNSFVFDEQEQVESFRISGSVREEDGHFLVNDVAADGRTKPGLEMRMKGNTQIPTKENPRPAQNQSLVMTITSPTIAALNLPEFGNVPELGHVTGSASYIPYRDGARLYDIKLEAGARKRVYATVKGSIGFVPYSFEQGLTGIDLAVHLSALDSASLGEAINYDLPDLGAIRASMQVTGNTNKLLIDRIELNTGSPDQPTIRANGTIRTRLKHQTSSMEIQFDVAVADLVAAYSQLPPGYLGRLQGNVTVSDLDGTWGLDSFEVESTGTDLYQLNFTGALDDVIKRDKAEIDLKLEIPDTVAFGDAAGIDLAGVAPYSMEGMLSFNNKQMHFKGRAAVGNTKITTGMNGSITGKRPYLKGELTIPVLYLTDIGLEPGVDKGTEIPDSGKLDKKKKARRPHFFSRKPIDFDNLKKLDLDLAISIDEIESKEISADELKGHIHLKDGLLRVSPMRLKAAGGPTDLDLEIDARQTPGITFKLTADDQKLGRWLAQLQNLVPVDGYANYDIELRATGYSPHDLASSLDGSVALAFENARVPRRYIEYLSVDVFGWALHTVADKNNKYANLDCTLANFTISEGVAVSNLLVSDGPHVAIEGTMTLNLGEETIDAVFLPKQKKQLFSRITPVKLTGDMRDPDVHAIPAKAAVARIGSVILLPYVAIPVMMFEQLWERVDDHDEHGGGCAALKEAKDKELKKARKAGDRGLKPEAEHVIDEWLD